MNWKEILPFDYEMQSIVCFLKIKNNFGVKIHRCLNAVYREENVMNLIQHLHIRASGEENDECTNHIFASSFVASFA